MTPPVFLVAVAEEEHVEQRAIDRRAEQLRQTLPLPSGRPFRHRRQPRRASPPAPPAAPGNGPLVCCWMYALAVAPRKPSSVSLISIGPAQRSRSRRNCLTACSARIMRIAAASSESSDPLVARARRGVHATTSFASPITRSRPGVDVSPPVTSSTRVRQADHPRRASRAAPAGKQAELHFGKAERRLVAVGQNAAVAPDRQLRAAADAHAVDRRDRDIMRLCEAGQTAAARGGRSRPLPPSARRAR